MFVFAAWAWLGSLDNSFWRDEIVTATQYVSGGPRAVFLGDYTPNNHPLFSLLTWATTGLLGESEIIFRIWSVIPALAAIAITWWWANKRSRSLGLIILALLASSPTLLDLAPQARGYGLAFLGMSLLLVGAIDRRWWLAVTGAVVGALALPVFVVPAALVLGPTLIWDREPKLVVAIGVAALTVFLWYLPFVDQVFNSAYQDFGSSLNWSDIFVKPVQNAGIRVGFSATLLLLGLGLSEIASLDRRLLAILVTPVLGTYVLLWLWGVGVVPRFTSYLVVPLLVIIGFIAAIPRVWPVALLLACWLIWLAIPRAVQTHEIPLEALRGSVQFASSVDLIYTNYAHPALLSYYSDVSIEKRPGEELVGFVCSKDRVAVIAFGEEDLTPPCSARQETFHQRARGDIRVLVRDG